MAKSGGRTRLPTQQRSRETVEAILGGASRVLLELGYDRLTTNRIAEAAGVNVATIYQYFPNKEAVVSELIDNEAIRIQEVFMAGIQAIEALPLVDGIPLLVRAMSVGPGEVFDLRAALHDAAQLLGKRSGVQEAEGLCLRVFQGYLASRKDKVKARDPDMAAFLSIRILFGVSVETSRLRPMPLVSTALTDELSRILVRLLTGSGESAAAP